MKLIGLFFILFCFRIAKAERPVGILPSSHPAARDDSMKGTHDFHAVAKTSDTSNEDFEKKMKFMKLIKRNQKAK